MKKSYSIKDLFNADLNISSKEIQEYRKKFSIENLLKLQKICEVKKDKTEIIKDYKKTFNNKNKKSIKKENKFSKLPKWKREYLASVSSYMLRTGDRNIAF